MKHAPPAPPELGTHDGLVVRAVPPGRRADGGRRDPARRGLGEGEPLRLRARLPRRRAWPRSPSTRAGTGARRASSARARSRTRWRCGAAARRTRRRSRCAARAWAASGDPRGRARTPRSPPSWRSARRRRTCCCAACAPASWQRFRLDREATEPLARVARPLRGGRPARAGHGAAADARRGRRADPLHGLARSCTRPRTSPSGCCVLPGGHHRSLQHDLELQAVSRRFIREATRRRRRRTRRAN